MPFVSIPGLPGKVYLPQERPPQARKHPCPGCMVCQGCSADRCRLCRCVEGEAPCDGATQAGRKGER
jgi:hypothetical protein